MNRLRKIAENEELQNKQYDWNSLQNFLNCYEISNLEVYLRGGKLVRGTAVNPNGSIKGYADSHTWVERDGQIIDHMNWVDHKAQDEINPMRQNDLDSVLQRVEEYEEW